ncbi:MAG: hypothetical protein E6Q27_02515 [Aeromicrobium sp.]|nr:MAG: hypothetical protein E6Q27_02515 [Aeromicrobium sp.]
MKRRLLLVALCAVLAMFTGACSSPDSPKTKPTASASKHEAPQMPDSAREFTEEGAEAFVRHYIETLNNSQWEGETQAILELSAPTCTNCHNMAGAIQDIKNAGGTFEGGLLVAHSLTTTFGMDKTIVSIESEFTEGSVTLERSAKPKHLPASRKDLHFDLAYSAKENSWVVDEIATDLK